MSDGVSKVFGAGALVLVVAAAVAIVTPGAKERRLLGDSKVVWRDGGKYYTVDVLWPDGGRSAEYRTATQAPCKRRLPGNELCFLIDGGLPPELNRYPADALEGVCDGVACSVLAGVDADGPEVEPTPEGQP